MQTSRRCGTCRFLAEPADTGPHCGPCDITTYSNWEPAVETMTVPMQQPRPVDPQKMSEIGEKIGAIRRAAAEAAPDSNPKTRFGMAKPPLALIPGAAKVQLSMAFRDGMQKYGPANWRVDPVSASTYLNAADRHITSWQDGEECAADSGVHHLAHAAACLLILLDAQVANSLIDDRPPACPTAELIKTLTQPLS